MADEVNGKLRALLWAVAALVAAAGVAVVAIGALAPGACLVALALTMAVPLAPGRVRRGARVLLAASAVLYVVVFVSVDPVWHHDAWPGRAEAAAAPDPCRVLRPPAPAAAPRRDAGGCEWGDALRLSYKRYEYATGLDGGIERARQDVRETAGKDLRPLPGVGDEARMSVALFRNTDEVLQIQIKAHKANVVAWLVYAPADGKRTESVAAAVRMTRQALDAVELD
ncbi:hypothetical protein ACQEU3_15545 [Spirillospora sp. CA-253888]